ncbi:hypothetical protein [Glutamicibacter ardleyensis]|uniref:hypothetical protein n=1 Tax=Glutamicibacter ardleyensis TaxID=225894 RepID=UPI003FCFEA60
MAAPNAARPAIAFATSVQASALDSEFNKALLTLSPAKTLTSDELVEVTTSILVI